MTIVRYAYLQTRLQARYGRLPDERLWSRLEAIASPAHFLSSLRATPLRAWLTNVGPHSDVHQAERAMRRLLRDEVTLVAGWYPREWQPAVRWVTTLIDLPALQHLLTAPAIPHWVREEPSLRPFAVDTPALRREALARSAFGPLVDGYGSGIPLPVAWTDHWRSLWPVALPADHAGPLRQLSDLFAEQQAQLAGGTLADSRPVRARLTASLARLFRRHPHQPCTGFVYLALAGVAIERLRGNLARLLLFGSEETAA